MAIFISNLIADVRGSINGVTFARNRSGAYMRNKTKPINPATLNQTTVRDRFGSIASNFQTLSRTQAEAWTQFAALIPRFNKLNQEYIPSGKQMFLELNLNRELVGLAQIGDPPIENTTVPAIDLKSAAVSLFVAGGVVTNFTIDNLINETQATHMAIQATPPMQAVRQSYRNRMRDSFAGAFTANPDLLTNWQNYFNGGDPVPASVGQIVNLRIKAVNSANGLASAWYYLTATAIAEP